MIIQTKELQGPSSYSALQVFYKLMIGLKIYAAYAHLNPEDFFAMLDGLSEIDKDKIIREALLIVPLEKEEMEILASFCTDKHGVPFRTENMRSLKPNDIMEILVKSCLELVKIKIDFVTESEKKNSEISQ